MIRTALVLGALLALAPASASAQQGATTQQCEVIRAMMWLAVAANQASGPDWDAMSLRERVACGGGMEAAEVEYWPNGATFRNGSTWYYPSGGYAVYGDVWYYPSGGYALYGDTWYYPSGGYALYGSTWYDWSGAYSSESALVSIALGRLDRARADELLGYRSASTTQFWSMIYLVVMVSEASR